MHSATGPKTPALAWLVQQFFTEYLVAQRALSPCTVACYRDSMMLFLGFAGRKLGKEPSALRLVDIRPDLILAFLNHLERERHNAVRSRNLRLTALRAFLKFSGRRDVVSTARCRAGAGGADEALGHADAGLPHSRRDACGAGATRFRLDLAARPSAAGDALQHRGAGIRDHRRARARCRP